MEFIRPTSVIEEVRGDEREIEVAAFPDCLPAIDRLKQYEPTLLRTSLSHEAEERLRAAMQVQTTA